MEIIIKLDHDEPVKVNTASIYGEQHPLPDWDPEYLWAELHKIKERYLQAEMDLKNQNDEIQNLKLENDHLKRRDELMEKALHYIACDCFCDDCVLVDNNDCDKLSVKMDLARNTLGKLVDL